MKKDDFIDVMGKINSEYIAEARRTSSVKKNINFKGLAAACIALFIVCGTFFFVFRKEPKKILDEANKNDDVLINSQTPFETAPPSGVITSPPLAEEPSIQNTPLPDFNGGVGDVTMSPVDEVTMSPEEAPNYDKITELYFYDKKSLVEHLTYSINCYYDFSPQIDGLVFNYARVDYDYDKVSMYYVYNGYEIELSYEFGAKNVPFNVDNSTETVEICGESYLSYSKKYNEFKRVRVLFAKENGNGFEIITINMTETLYSMVEENQGSYIIKKML